MWGISRDRNWKPNGVRDHAAGCRGVPFQLATGVPFQFAVACWSCPKKVDTQLGAFGSRKDDEAMGVSRKKYSREFKIEAVKQVVEQGRSVSDVAKALGLNLNMLFRWRLELAPDGVVAPLKGTSADEEIHRLRRELATAQQERDILKKALAYFAKNKN